MMTQKVASAMIRYFEGDMRRIQHFLKVFAYARLIGMAENLDSDTQNILDIAALTHDIGIKNSEMKYNDCSGYHQQIEGPPEARNMLKSLEFSLKEIDRVCFLIAHHHTYTEVEDEALQILLEADFLVNAQEDQLAAQAIRSFRDKVFRTPSGVRLLNTLFEL